MYHFLSGYASKLAGTERGVTTPEATFPTCFGAPFMSLPPARYARMLGERLDRHGARCRLVNTGWSGVPYGVGERMDLGLTRLMVQAVLERALSDVPIVADSRMTWSDASASDASAYEAAARALAARFVENFRRIESASGDLAAAGPAPF